MGTFRSRCRSRAKRGTSARRSCAGSCWSPSACGRCLSERRPRRSFTARVDRDEYTVEKVILESWPGHYVTGNLYRPKGKSGKLAAVLCPHGHWNNGRFYDAGENGVKQQIEQGGEKFEVGGRYPLQARCVQLARMGCVVFHYDMLGYADSVQIPHSVAHGFRERRPDMEKRRCVGILQPAGRVAFAKHHGIADV